MRDVGAVTGGGDPGDEDAVGMLDEVVPSERVDDVAVAGQVCGGDGHDLPVAPRHGVPSRPSHELVSIGREESRLHQSERIVAGS